MPDDASALVAARRRDRGTHSLGHREVLVRLRDAHDQALGRVIERREVAVELSKTLHIKQTIKQQVQLRDRLAGHNHVVGVYRAAVLIYIPRRKVVPRSKRRTVLRAEVIRRNHNIGKAEGHAEFLDVGLQLVVGALDGGTRARLLQLNKRQRHAVDVTDHIKATLSIQVRNGDLVERQIVVHVRMRGQEADGWVLNVALVVDVLDTAVAFHQNLVNAPVLRNRGL